MSTFPRRIIIMRVSTVGSTLRTFCLRQMKELGKQYDVIAVSDPDKDLEAISSEGIRTEAVRMRRRIAPFSDLRSIWKMYRLLRKTKPDIIHSVSPKAGMVSMIAGRLAGVPVRVHTFTGLVWPTENGVRKKVLMLVDRLLCACATDIIAEGEGVRRSLEELPYKRAVVLGDGSLCGVDTERFSPADNRPGKARFIFVGRLVADKGIEMLVDAFLKVRQKIPYAQLTLVGSEEAALDPLPERTLDIIHGNEAIHHAGQRSDVENWLRESDCLILPSRREGFPNALLEAAATGIPSISTPVNGALEILAKPGCEAGIIVPHSDVAALSAAMEKIATDDNLSAALGRNGRSVVLKYFSRETVLDNLRRFYAGKKL